MIHPRLLVLTLALVVPPAAYGQLRHYVDVRPIERRPEHDEPPKYFLMFAARKADPANLSPGHAFVMWGVEDPVRKMSVVNSFGLYPSVKGVALAEAAFGPVPGALRDEALKLEYEGCCSWNNPTYLVVMRVGKSTYDKTDRVRQDYNANISQFQLAEQDCVTFLIDVGKTAGFEMPARAGLAKFPAPYMDAFIRRLETPEGGMITLDGRNYRVRSEARGPGHVGWSGLREADDGGKPLPSVTARARRSPSPMDGYRAKIESEEVYKGERTWNAHTFADGDEWEQYRLNFGLPFDFSGNPAIELRYRRTDGQVVYGVPYPDLKNAPPTRMATGWYAGDWQKGVPHGKGEWRLDDGAWYVGDFVNGRFEGQGSARFANGEAYTGNWSNGVTHGAGVYTFSDGRTWIGNFINGTFGSGRTGQRASTVPSAPPATSSGPALIGPPSNTPQGPLVFPPINPFSTPSPPPPQTPAPTVIPSVIP